MPASGATMTPMRSMLWSLMFVSLIALPLLALAYYVVIMLYAQRL